MSDAAITKHADHFGRDTYVIRRKVFKLFGGAFHIYDQSMQQVQFYAEQKAFKLKEDFTVFGDEAKTKPMLKIKARSVLDFGATYDITDAQTGEKVGAARRQAMASILRDKWMILDAQDREIGVAEEDSMLLALIRRFLSNLVPQSFTLNSTGGEPWGSFRQHFNPFVFRMELNYERDTALDRRLGIGVAVCMTAIEGRQG